MPAWRSPIAWSTVMALTSIVAAFAQSPAANAADAVCSSLDAPIHERSSPTSGSSFLTTWLQRASEAEARGFTKRHPTPFTASATAKSKLVGVHRLFRESQNDYLYTSDESEVASARRTHGYVDQGIKFYAAPPAADCGVAVHRYLSPRGKHRLVAGQADRALLARQGWRSEGVFFRAAASRGAVAPVQPPAGPSDSSFTLAVMPDTQQEVLRRRDDRMLHRARWLAANRAALDLRYVAHSGDVVNWDTPDHAQYEVASAAMAPLEAARIPYSLAIGNHDTAATCPGGSACDPRRTRTLFRDTRTFNRYFTQSRFGAVRGAYEAGKVDNIYSTFEAGGVSWLVLNLEMWPRSGAIEWAKRVVATHADHNVIVVTHYYLDAFGNIAGNDAGYGDNSPQRLYDELIGRYANIRFVFSGHVGTVAHRRDTGVHGNVVHSFLEAIHDSTSNPVRLLTVDTSANTLRTWVYSPLTRAVYPGSTLTLSGLGLVR